MPIAEIALFHIQEDQVEAFIAAAVDFAPRFIAGTGAHYWETWRSLDVPTDVHCVIGWDSVEAHTVEAPKTAAYQEWVAIASPMYSRECTVYHVERAAAEL